MSLPWKYRKKKGVCLSSAGAHVPNVYLSGKHSGDFSQSEHACQKATHVTPGFAKPPVPACSSRTLNLP